MKKTLYLLLPFAFLLMGCLEKPLNPSEGGVEERVHQGGSARAALAGIGLPGRIQAEDYRAGGAGVGFHDMTGGNSGGQYRWDNVDIEASTDAGGGFNVGWIDAGEWLAYDVSVAQGGSYTFILRMASAVSGTKSAVVSVDGAAVGTFSLTDASGWQSWKSVTVQNVRLTAGNHVLRISMSTGGFNINYLDVVVQGNVPPAAHAGPDQSVTVNTRVTLDGRGSSDGDNGPSPLSYSWTQVLGTSVALASTSSAQPTFTPSVAARYAFRLTVSDGAASASDTVVVVAGSGSDTTRSVVIGLPGRIQAEDYKAGGAGVGYHDLTAGNTGGKYRSDAVDIESTTDLGGGHNVGWIDAGEWLSYDVSVAQSGTYALTLRMASAASGTKTAAVTVDGAELAVFSLGDASGWQSWKDMTVPNVSLAAGSHALRIVMRSGGFNVNYLDVAKQPVILQPEAGFSGSRFNFGTTYRSDSQKEVHYLYQWIGWSGKPFDDGWDGQLFRDVSPGGKFAGKTPFVYAYIIAFTARADLNLKDCNVGSPNLCEDGANYIRANRARILGQYKSWAEGIARNYKSGGKVIWMMEPDYIQYSDRTQKGGPHGPSSADSWGRSSRRCGPRFRTRCFPWTSPRGSPTRRAGSGTST